jgi:hypothetical protein
VHFGIPKSLMSPSKELIQAISYATLHFGIQKTYNQYLSQLQ